MLSWVEHEKMFKNVEARYLNNINLISKYSVTFYSFHMHLTTGWGLENGYVYYVLRHKLHVITCIPLHNEVARVYRICLEHKYVRT